MNEGFESVDMDAIISKLDLEDDLVDASWQVERNKHKDNGTHRGMGIFVVDNKKQEN